MKVAVLPSTSRPAPQARRTALLSAPVLVLALAVALALVVAGAALAFDTRWNLLRPGGRAPQALRYAASAYDPEPSG